MADDSNLYVGEVSEHAIIFNELGEVLLLQHNGAGNTNSRHYGKWHFPGGRLDRDDQPGEALLREIFEETGLKDVEIILPCHASRWGFGDPVKYSVGYLALAKGRPEVVLPVDEHHMAARWTPYTELNNLNFLSEKHLEVIGACYTWGKKLGLLA